MNIFSRISNSSKRMASMALYFESSAKQVPSTQENLRAEIYFEFEPTIGVLITFKDTQIITNGCFFDTTPLCVVPEPHRKNPDSFATEIYSALKSARRFEPIKSIIGPDADNYLITEVQSLDKHIKNSLTRRVS